MSEIFSKAEQLRETSVTISGEMILGINRPPSAWGLSAFNFLSRDRIPAAPRCRAENRSDWPPEVPRK